MSQVMNATASRGHSVAVVCFGQFDVRWHYLHCHKQQRCVSINSWIFSWKAMPFSWFQGISNDSPMQCFYLFRCQTQLFNDLSNWVVNQAYQGSRLSEHKFRKHQMWNYSDSSLPLHSLKKKVILNIIAIYCVATVLTIVFHLCIITTPQYGCTHKKRRKWIILCRK